MMASGIDVKPPRWMGSGSSVFMLMDHLAWLGFHFHGFLSNCMKPTSMVGFTLDVGSVIRFGGKSDLLYVFGKGGNQ